jgi:sec-independent protein translocase protein TatC
MPIQSDEQLSLVEHLDELRKRITWSLVALAVGIVVAFIFNGLVFDLLLAPLPPTTTQITTFSPAEPFMVTLKVCAVFGAILASPYLIYQFWAFVGPGFTSTERRHFVPVVVVSSALFLLGVAIGYVLVLPRALEALLGINPSAAFQIELRANDYFTFVAMFLLAFGVVFELPVILVLLAKVGVIDDRFLRKNRRFAILIGAIAAALLTPSPDAFSMLAMFVPLLVLYEISIWLAKLVQPKRDDETAGEHPEGEAPPARA